MSIKRLETSSSYQKRVDYESDDPSKKEKKKDMDINKDESDSINLNKNSSIDERSIKLNNPSIINNSCDSNLSEFSSCSHTKPTTNISKRDNSFGDMKNNIRALKRIEEDNINQNIRSHVDSSYNSSFDNRAEAETSSRKKSGEYMKSSFKSDLIYSPQLSKNEKNATPVINNPIAINNSRVNDTMSSVNSMTKYKTMINVNQIDSIDHSSNDGIVRSCVIRPETQNYLSSYELSSSKRMLDSDTFKKVTQERHLYDKKGANIKLHELALNIYDKYICPGSVYELNLKSKTMKEISEKINNSRKDQVFSEDIFNQAYLEVLQNLYLTSFQKFLNFDKNDENDENDNYKIVSTKVDSDSKSDSKSESKSESKIESKIDDDFN